MWFPDPPSIERLNSAMAPQFSEDFAKEWGTWGEYLSNMAMLFYLSHVPDLSVRLLEVLAAQLDKALSEEASLQNASIEFEIFEEQIVQCEKEWASEADKFFAADLEFASKYQADGELVDYFLTLIREGVRRVRADAIRLYQDKVGEQPPGLREIERKR